MGGGAKPPPGLFWMVSRRGDAASNHECRLTLGFIFLHKSVQHPYRGTHLEIPAGPGRRFGRRFLDLNMHIGTVSVIVQRRLGLRAKSHPPPALPPHRFGRKFPGNSKAAPGGGVRDGGEGGDLSILHWAAAAIVHFVVASTYAGFSWDQGAPKSRRHISFPVHVGSVYFKCSEIHRI